MLTAPSGKAAIRLQESVQLGKEGLNFPAEIKEWMPGEAATIHRLLGAIPESPYFKHDADHQLLVDAVIVDEASMIDLATMAKLFAATPITARMILLGDKDQLASVEAGSVLGDICRVSTSRPPPAHSMMTRAVSSPSPLTKRTLTLPCRILLSSLIGIIVSLRKAASISWSRQ